MKIIQLYPEPDHRDDVRGLYLNDPLLAGDDALVYGNFLTSLDGRIAVVEGGVARLPEALTTPNDLRLFLELEAHADCIVTHGGYMRALAQGRLGDILHIGSEYAHRDLADWRRSRGGLTAQPMVAVCSNTLDFPVPVTLDCNRVWIIAGKDHDPARRRDWENRGFRVTVAGAGGRVEAGPLVRRLSNAGYRRIYLAAGPELLESCLAEGCLDLLYLTIACRFIGREDFLTMMPGLQKLDHCRLEPARLVLDASAEQHAQIYASFRCGYSRPPSPFPSTPTGC